MVDCEAFRLPSARREGQAVNLSNNYCLNVRGVKGKRPKRKTEPDDPVQSARFIEAAKSLGVDESGKAFKRALDAVLPKKTGRKKTKG